MQSFIEYLTEYFSLLAKGFGNTVLITGLSVFWPLVLGIGWTVLMHFTKKTPVPKIFRILSVFSEAVVPVLFLYILYFIPSFVWGFKMLTTTRWLTVVLALAIAYLGYMAFRYEPNDSLQKNIVVNGIGLVADVFKWSTIASMVMVTDIVRMATMWVATKAELFPLLFSFAVMSSISLVLYLAKALCKNFMK